MSKRREHIDPAPHQLKTSFADLLGQRGVAVGSAALASDPEDRADAADLAGCGKVVVRRERKGRGGKTVTVVSGLPVATLTAVARTLRKALGCGVTIADESVVLQGDLTTRAGAWLAAHGATRIVIAN